MAVLYVKDAKSAKFFQVININASEHQLFTLTVYIGYLFKCLYN